MYSNTYSKEISTLDATDSPVILCVHKVSKSVEQRDCNLVILPEISFDVRRGSTLAIVGASGSGKSTLLAIMAGLDRPSSGTVTVDGQDLFQLDEDARAMLRARMMGFVFQNFQLMPNLTALENVMLPLELAGEKEARKRAAEMLAQVGLAERLHHYPKVLSGGEQQRVALARAFVTHPLILLADEPTGSLDPVTGDKIMKLMTDLNAAHGTTLILVTHDMKVAENCQYCLKI